MKNKLPFIVMLLLLSSNVFSQDGKIISQQLVTFHDSIISKFEESNPKLREKLFAVELYSITYISDGLKVNGYMSFPKKAGKYPAIIYNRGGNREAGKIDDERKIIFLVEIASWGYVCVGSQYRGNDGSEGKEEFGGKDINDVMNLISALSYISKADTSRIGMYGWSRGGMMTYLALTKTTKIKAAVIGSGLANAFMSVIKFPTLDSVLTQITPRFKENRDSVLTTRSAIRWADKICKTTPLLLMTGGADWRVSAEEQMEMSKKLLEIKHPHRFILFEGGQHSLVEHRDEVNYAAKSFLNKYVRDEEKWPSLDLHGN